MQLHCASAGIVSNPSAVKRNLENSRRASDAQSQYDSTCVTLPLYDSHSTLTSKTHGAAVHDSDINTRTANRHAVQTLHHTTILDDNTAFLENNVCLNDPVRCDNSRVAVDASRNMIPPFPTEALQRYPTPSEDSAKSSPADSSTAMSASTAPSSISSASSLNLTLPSAPPKIIRQAAHQYSYVDSLVDAATLIVDTLWPSMAKNGRASGKMLSYFITETSRKSKTSLSTMQLTLFYCIKYKRQQLLRCNAISNARMDGSAKEATVASIGSTCARRNFLSALILASKFLQDRNFSNKAWSKISGVPVTEVNTREREFLEMLQWGLDVRHELFKDWSATVDSLISEIRETTMFGEAPACQAKWRHTVQRMSIMSQTQMNELLGRLVNEQPSATKNYQLATPLPSPTDSLTASFDFRMDAVAGASASAPIVITAEEGTPPKATVCQLYEQFIQCSPQQEGIHDGQADYMTPQSLRDASPASSEDSFQSSGSSALSGTALQHAAIPCNGLLTPGACLPRGMKRRNDGVYGNSASVDVKKLCM